MRDLSDDPNAGEGLRMMAPGPRSLGSERIG